MTDFVNLKIKSTQSFRDAYKDRVCVHIFIRIIFHTYMSIYICTLFLKKSYFFNNHLPHFPVSFSHLEVLHFLSFFFNQMACTFLQ
jgi:hypothetical protein